MKLLLKSGLFLSLMLTVLYATSCYPAHSGSGGGSNNSGGGGNTGGSGPSGGNTSTFTIGGSVIGLLGTGMVLQDNGGDSLTIRVNGTFTFTTAVTGAYAVTISTPPTNPAQVCSISNGTGTATANVSNVVINCGTSGLTIGGSVSGLIGTGLVLQDNGGDNFAVTGTANVPFTFTAPVSSGAAYSVTILSMPKNPTQTCSVVSGSGTATTNVTTVEVICAQPAFTISGAVVGLEEASGDTLELQDNAGDDLFVTGDTTFTFATPVTEGGIFNVQTFLEPHSQLQPCSDFFYTGIALGNVSGVLVDCQHNEWGWNTWPIDSTRNANNYASVTTPLLPPNEPFPPDLGTPGGRDFAVAWTDNTPLHRRWLFGGEGWPYPSPLGPQVLGLLNDLWVFDPSLYPAGGWVPANLPTFTNSASAPAVYQLRVGPLELEDVASNPISSPGNPAYPGSRWGSTGWTSNSGDLYLFGGQGVGGSQGLLNDLWKCTPGATIDPGGAGTSSCPWSQVAGPTASGSYGTQGVSGGDPGGRWAAAGTKDPSGNFWLFGGQGVDSTGTTIGLLNDLWMYNPVSNQWTWMGPSTSNAAGQNGSYGTLGQPTGTTAPGGRQAAVLWADTSGNIWLFGGFGLDSVGSSTSGSPTAGAILNDLWEFNVTTKQWTWVSGNKLANQTGNYGAKASTNLSVGAAANFPGSRWGAVGWTDANNNLWLIGGWGYGSTTTAPTGFLNDIWEYQKSSGNWIWWKGISNANQNSVFAIKDDAAVLSDLPFSLNVVGGRRGSAFWGPDSLGYVYIFGGEGYDHSNGAPPGYLNDQWTYLPFQN